MPTTEMLPLRSLKLDLCNFRTVPQKNEAEAVSSMINLNPDRFWALCKSLYDDGYHPTENIIVVRQAKKFLVKEGNRRIAAMKLLFRQLKNADIELPSELQAKSEILSAGGAIVPCSIYETDELETVHKIIARIHANKEAAGRTKWNTVAKARWAREMKGEQELGLDLLEKYLREAKNASAEQKERWAGDFPLTVLDELLNTRRLHERCAEESAQSMVTHYPKVRNRRALDSLIKSIGQELTGYKEIRFPNGLDVFFGPISSKPVADEPDGSVGNTHTTTTTGSQPNSTSRTVPALQKKSAIPITDEKAVMERIRKFKPKGSNREKVVSLLQEARHLSLKDTPLCFCFVLRSMFEISAKIYCQENNIPTVKDGNEITLKEMLRKCHDFLTDGKKNREMQRTLHGPMAELASEDGLLSITSLNRLVHSTSFSLSVDHISRVFFNVMPLLEILNG